MSDNQPKMVELIAVGSIVLSVPGAPDVVGGFDKDGSPIVRRATREVSNGEPFTVDEGEAAALLALGAAHRPGHEPRASDWPIAATEGKR